MSILEVPGTRPCYEATATDDHRLETDADDARRFHGGVVMGRRRWLVILLAAAAAAAAVTRHGHGAAMGRRVPGGILIRGALVYDTLSRLLLGPFLGRVAADVAAAARPGPGAQGGVRPATCRSGWLASTAWR
jgi:hypothetical protein